MSSSIQKMLEGKIDFEGQKGVERVSQYSMICATVISFVAGFAVQSLRLTLSLLGLSFISVMLVTVPPWSFWRKHPVKWLPVTDAKKKQ